VSSFYSREVDESFFDMSPDELNANSVTDIKTFNSHISFPSTGEWERRTQVPFSEAPAMNLLNRMLDWPSIFSCF